VVLQLSCCKEEGSSGRAEIRVPAQYRLLSVEGSEGRVVIGVVVI
jgi:hypothetical protein